MKRILYLILLLPFAPGITAAQKAANDYLQFYPIGDDPNLRYMTSYRKEETILFEANPVVRFSFANNFYKALVNNKSHTRAWYVNVKPQLRLYVENSIPAKTPSDRVLLGTQHMFRLKPLENGGEHFLAFSVESGHYSNGQSKSAFSDEFDDASPESDSLYRLITPQTKLSEILNRRSGNFSTNLTEIIFNYRRYRLSEDDNAPTKMHSFSIGTTIYHDLFWGFLDFGGYSAQDIKIYGHYRFHAAYEYMRVFAISEKKMRISFSHKVELIQGAHASVNPYRGETAVSLYPFERVKAFGFCVSYIAGHDNYNYRFVDSGHQMTFGITWSQFPPFTITNKLPK